MHLLILVSLVWAFSFPLVKQLTLAGLDSYLIAFIRLAVALPVFLPFLRLSGVGRVLALKLTGVGAVQFGLMYVAYTYSYNYLAAYEVALYTIFTPLYVLLLHEGLRGLNAWRLLAAFVVIPGAMVIWGPLVKVLRRRDRRVLLVDEEGDLVGRGVVLAGDENSVVRDVDAALPER